VPRIIAPRLVSGDSREAIGHGLPPEIKAGLRAIAKAENKSMSWVLEQVIIRYFHLPRPEYKHKPKSLKLVPGHRRRA
jgi:hypothetical protein